MMKYVESQEEFNQYSETLDKFSHPKTFNMWNPTRAPFFWMRYYLYTALFKFHYGFPANYTFLKPGLEIKFALEEAEKQGAKTYFLGGELDQVTWKRLYHETRLNVTNYLYNKFVYMQFDRWALEKQEIN